MTNKEKVISGTVGALATIWVGSFALHLAPEWAQFATVITCAVILVVFVFVAGAGLDGAKKGLK